jgi:hypothetical protein
MTRLPLNGAKIEVWDNPGQAGVNDTEPPTGFDWQQEPHRILEVCNCWRIHARWWEHEQAVWREYFKVTTDSGLLCLIYHDLQSGDWFLSRIYD